MKYVNETVRRQDRLLTEERAIELIKTSEYGVLSMITPDGEAYGLPLNYVWDGCESLYVHCAPDGKKLECISHCPSVSFCIVGNTNLLPARFTTEYESVVMKCRAVIGLTDDEKHRAISLLIDKLSPDFKETGEKYAEKSFHRVDIIRLDIVEFSGKCKFVPSAH